MKKKKILIAVLAVIILMFLVINESLAAGSFSASLTPNNTKVSKGSEVKVTLKVSGINVDGGISSLVATLDYDSDVLSLSDKKALNDWTITYNEDNSKLVLDKADAITDDQEIATFTFKVAENTSATTTSIKIKSISAGNSTIDEPATISDVTTSITIGTTTITTSPSTSTSPSTEPSESPTTIPGGNNTSNNAVNNVPNGNNNTSGSNISTTGNEPVPYTGTASNYVIPLMIIIAILGIVSFVNYKKIDG